MFFSGNLHRVAQTAQHIGMAKQLKDLGGKAATGELRYDPDASDLNGELEFIADAELLGAANVYREFQEPIVRIDQYNSNLFEAQGKPQSGIHHSYMVVETDKAFYSVEKDGDGITMQRSTQEDDVLSAPLHGEKRSGVTWIH